MQPGVKRILHLDMDAFFASVEQADNPELRGKPVIIGGQDRGVVSTCSYEARVFGVHSAMPSAEARRLCPQGVFMHGHMHRYKEVSQQIMAVLQDFSPLVEQASVDEAYLDVTGTERLFGPPEQLAAAIKQAISARTGLTCSIGMAPVKFLAKIASDYRKPDGLFILEPEQVPEFLRTLPVAKIPGVGARGLERLRALNIVHAADIQRFSRAFWVDKLGKWGEMLYARGHGLGSDEVVTEYEAKSESAENTFEQDTADRELLCRWLLLQAERVGANLRRMGAEGRTVTLKVKFSDFKQITRSKTLRTPTNNTERIFHTATELLQALDLYRPVRLIGVGVSNFDTAPRQLSLLPEETDAKQAKLDAALDGIREKFGKDSLVRGRPVRLQTPPLSPRRHSPQMADALQQGRVRVVQGHVKGVGGEVGEVAAGQAFQAADEVFARARALRRERVCLVFKRTRQFVQRAGPGAWRAAKTERKKSPAPYTRTASGSAGPGRVPAYAGPATRQRAGLRFWRCSTAAASGCARACNGRSRGPAPPESPGWSS